MRKTGHPGRKPGTATVSRWAWWIHGIAGLKLGLIVAFVVITGTLATLGHEWDWLFGSYQRVSPNGEAAGLAEIHDAIRAARPEYALLSIEAPRGRTWAASAIAVSPERQFRRIYVDPYRPDQVQVTSLVSAQFFLRQVHMSLLLPEYGRMFVSALGILTLVSIISGLIAYKRFWRGFLRIPRRRDLRTFLGDAHRLAAVWSIWFLAVIAVTSLWYLYESLDTFGPHLGTPDLPAAALEAPAARSGERISVAAAITAAREAVPGLQPQRLELPGWADEPIVVQGRSGAWLVRPRATSVAVNPYSGEAVDVQRAQDLGLQARLHEAADPLHFGTFGGIWTKLIWFVFGLAMSFLSISGLMIHAKRLARGRPREAGNRDSRRRSLRETQWGAGAT